MELKKAAVCVGIAGLTILAMRRAIMYFTRRCPSKAMMVGKIILITGANCGIGYETALEMARRQGHVILACRDVRKGQKAAENITRITGNIDVTVKKLDLASFKSVREFCKNIEQSNTKIDVLINNAGVMNCPYSLSENCLENHMAVNHFGNFLLTNLLIDCLSPMARVVFVSSSLHKYGKVKLDDFTSEERFKQGRPYADSKLMNVLFAREFHNRVTRNKNILVFTVHPGIVRTLLGRHTIFFNQYFRVFCFPIFAVLYSLYVLLVQSAKEGCQTVVYCAVSPELEGMSDGYYGNCKREPWSKPASDLNLASQVWNISVKVTGLDKVI